MKVHLKSKHGQECEEFLQKEKEITRKNESALANSKKSQCNFRNMLLKGTCRVFHWTQVQNRSKTRGEKDITTQENIKELVIEPPLETFWRLSKLVSKQIPQNQLEEVDLFIQQRKRNSPDVMDTLDFWVKSESLFPVLSKVACDVLVVPASSGPVERTFSIAGNSCIGKKIS